MTAAPAELFFEREARLAVHLACLFHPLPTDLITRHVDDVSWPGIALNEHIDWSDGFIEQHRARLPPHRLGQNPAIGWTESMEKAFGPRTGVPPTSYGGPEARTLGDVLQPWAAAGLERSRPLASLTLEEAAASARDLLWEPLLLSSSSPWTEAWSPPMARVVEEPHHDVSNFPRALLRQIYDALCAPALQSDAEAFLTSFFGREPHYEACTVAVSDALGVLPTVQIAPSAYGGWKDGEPVPVAVNAYAQGPRRSVPMSGVHMLLKGKCIVLDRQWKDTFSSFVLPTHSFHEVKLAPTKKLSGEPVLLRLDDVFVEGAILTEPYDLLIALRADAEARFFGFELVFSRRAARLLREKGLPNVMFSPAAVMRFSMAAGAAAPRPLETASAIEAPPIQLTEAQSFFAEKRARMMASKVVLPASHTPTKSALGKAEVRLGRVFPPELAALLAKHGRKRIDGYRLLAPGEMYLLDAHGYELEHPESWGAVAIAENGTGDCIGLLLRKRSDTELGATLYEFMHETGRIRRWRAKTV